MRYRLDSYQYLQELKSFIEASKIRISLFQATGSNFGVFEV